MNPYFKFLLKSISVFIGSIGLQQGVRTFVGSDFHYITFLWPGIVGVGIYWGAVADTTPAPWSTVTKQQDK